MRLDCPCGKTLVVPDSLAGKKARCPKCLEVVSVPELAGKTVEAVIVAPAPLGEPLIWV